ncbi:MAG: right-handed parallel beta-helix repeat-containing protein [Solirubrobacterales bacterium]
MRKRPTIAAFVVLGIVASPPPSASAAASAGDFKIYTKQRYRAAKRLDRATGMVNAYKGARVQRRQYNGIDALVIARDMNFAELAKRAPRDLKEVKPGVWQLRRTVFVTNGATLSITARDVRELRLLSDRAGWSSLVTRNASLRFRGRRNRRLLIRSWNPRTGRPDKFLEDGRASVSVRWRGRLDSFDTTFSDLGFYEGRVSGVAVIGPSKSNGGTGTVYRSRFEGNVFGAFSFHANDMRWVNNVFVRNFAYGFDPHDGSNNFLAERNYAAYNGKHGIIFSRFCVNNVIRNNLSEKNGWHGIVLDDGKAADGPSNFNQVYNNVVRDNGRVGISIDGSQRTTIRDNVISGHHYGIRLYGPTSDTMIRGNKIVDSSSFGVFVDNPTHSSWIIGNRIEGAFTGVRVRNSRRAVIRANRFTRMNGHAVKFDGDAVTNSSAASNSFTGKGASPLLLDLTDENDVSIGENSGDWNFTFAHDLARMLSWVIGPAFWIGLLGLAVLGPLILKVSGRSDRRAPA